MGKSVAIGLTKLHYAILTTDRAPKTDSPTDPGELVYEDPVRLPGAITANFSPKATNDTLFADDGPYDTASTLGAMSLELNVADIPPRHRAVLLGCTYDETTGMVKDSANDIPPYLAVGCAVKKSNGFDRLIWYLKGKFAAPDDNNQTKSDSINWNTPTITGNFLKRDYDDQWRYSVDTDDEAYTGDKVDFTEWFTKETLMTGSYTGGGGGTLTVTVAPTTATVAPEGTQQLTATASDNTATITYASNNAKVTVSDAGLVTVAADATGTATITVTATKGSDTATATCVITVSD
jgi:phi13 family phage major tail protein